MEKVKTIIIKYKGYIICLVIIVLSIISIVIQDLDRKNTLISNSNEIVSSDNKIIVYISGAVKNPGIYKLDKEARIYNLLDACGGLLENADIDKINPAQKLLDSDKIVVPEKKIAVEEYISNIDENESDDKININKASLEELKTLSGIGDATAKKIIEYRNNNIFNNVEDIMNVPGIGESKFNNIKDSICTK